MRRLISVASYGELRSGFVWHIDHLVEPFRWAEHWEVNWATYCSCASRHGVLMIDNFFGTGDRPQSDPRVYLGPVSNWRSDLGPKYGHLSASHRAAIDTYLERVWSDSDTCAVFLFGSGRRHASPRDLDLARLVLRPNAFACSITSLAGIGVEEEQRSLLDMVYVFSQPGRNPDVWPWMLARYDARWILASRVNLFGYLNHLRASARRVYGYHLVTYHVGNALREFAHSKSRTSLSALRHVSVLVGLGLDELPDRWRYPFFTDKRAADRVRRTAQALRTGDSTSKLALLRGLARRAAQKLGADNLHGRAIFPVSEDGAELLRESGLKIAAPVPTG